MPIAELTNFAGGVHSRVRSIWSPMDEHQAMYFWDDAQNWDLSEEGILKFKGWDGVLDSAISGTPRITGIFEYKSGSTIRLLICAGTKIYTVSGGTTTEVLTGQTADYYYQGVMWNDGSNDLLLLCNGIDTPVAYNGSTCTAITFTDPNSIWDSAKPFTVAVFRDRVFWADENKVYTPRPGSHNNFDNSANTVDGFAVDQGYGGKITGIKTLTNDILIIYKESVIRRLSGSAPFAAGGEQFQITPVTDEVGCVAPRSIVQVGADHYFMGRNGLRQLKPVDAYGDLDHLQPTYPIQDKINTINWSDATAIKNICATYSQSDNHIYLCVPDGSSTTNNKVYVYDTITKGICPRTQLLASYITVYNRTLYHGDYAGQIHSHGSTNSANGTAIDCFAETKWMAHGGIGAYKRYKKIIIFAEGDGETDLTIVTKILKRGKVASTSRTEDIVAGDSAWDSGVWDTATWSSGTQNVFEIKNPGRGKALKLRFTSNSASQRPKIRQIFIEYDVFGTMKG